MTIGLEAGVVRLAAYTPVWQELYQREERAIRGIIGEHVLDIQHVGSTAVPGVVAKPIIDIAVAVAEYEAARVCIEPMEQLGYEYRGPYGIPGRHYFVRGEPRTHHVHMLELDNIEWKRLILFRDALRNDAALVAEYSRLKGRLAEQFPNDRVAYTDGKAAFVNRVIDAAAGKSRPA